MFRFHAHRMKSSREAEKPGLPRLTRVLHSPARLQAGLLSTERQQLDVPPVAQGPQCPIGLFLTHSPTPFSGRTLCRMGSITAKDLFLFLPLPFPLRPLFLPLAQALDYLHTAHGKRWDVLKWKNCNH